MFKIVAIIVSVSALSLTSSDSKTRTARNAKPTPRIAISRMPGSTGASITINPFIARIQLQASDPTAVQSITFTIAPKAGSVTRPLSATFTSAYLQDRGYFDSKTGAITLPVFGLYDNYANTVNLTYGFTDGSKQQDSTTITTPAFSDPCGLNAPTIVQARTSSTDLSYDYMLVKNTCSTDAPTILDTDGAIRWVGTANVTSLAWIFLDNGFFVAGNSLAGPGSTNKSGVTRLELDGTSHPVADYSASPNNVTDAGHHNIDPGKYGMLLEVNTTDWNETVVMEVDNCGDILKTWNVGVIISNAMMAGGDNPADFVYPKDTEPADWFHMNAVTYRSSDDTLVVSSRENFIIALDYDTGAIRWILGDPTKKWYQFASLRAFALALDPYTLPPIGQHALSFDNNDNLLLFDDGLASIDAHNSPAGASRTYSAPRAYHLDLQNYVATEIWNYPNGESAYSPVCSSVYEDAPLNYVVDYAAINFQTGNPTFMKLLGLTAANEKVFDYEYHKNNICNEGWNVVPVHWENLSFDVPNPGQLQVSSLRLDSSKNTVRFFAIAQKEYILEYTTDLVNPNWQTAGQVIATCTGPTALIDSSATGQSERFYRLRSL